MSAALYHEAEFVFSNDARLRSEIDTWHGQVAETGRLGGAVSADELAGGLLAESPEAVTTVITSMSQRFRNPTRTFAETLRILSVAMPSLRSIEQAPRRTPS